MADAISWRSEIGVALVVTLFVAMLGAPVGLIWHAIAPHIDVTAAIANVEERTKPFVGDDLWLGAIGVVAGIACAALLAVVAPGAADGPGAQVGLAAGGIVAMLIADRVGNLIGVPGLNAALHAAFPTASHDSLKPAVELLDFKVRATAVLFAWPVASVLVSAIVAWVRAANRPTARAVPTYPGSP